jgi:hypothetical protein
MCLESIGLKLLFAFSHLVFMCGKYVVRIYYSGYITKVVDAKNEEDALLKARKEHMDMEEILPTLERWEMADEVIVED